MQRTSWMGRAGVAVAMAVAAAAPPSAAQQGEGCWVTRDGERPFGHNTPAYYDEASTRQWQQVLMRADGMAMSQHAGTYYAEIPAPQLGMVNYQYRTLDANGGFEYQDRTCSAVSCSQNYGYGRWAGVPQGDGSMFIMINFSDLIRHSACVSWVGQLNGGAFLTPEGVAWRKVR